MKRRSTRSFAEIVDDVRQAPRSEDHHVRDAGASLTDPTGRTWREVEEQVTPERAQALVAEGAALAWDGCGSRGYAAAIEWVSREDAARLAAGGPPVLRTTKRHRAELSAWQADDGSRLVLASMSVRWGRRFV